MTRQAIASVLLLCAALALVLFGVLALVQRDREALIDQFAAGRQSLVKEASQSVTDALEDVGDDLRFAAELLAQPRGAHEHERELRALLEVVGQYKAVAVYGTGGEPQLMLLDRGADAQVRSGAFSSVMAETASRAIAEAPGAIVTSRPAEAGGSWMRVFATSFIAGDLKGAVVVLIDTEPFFAPFRILAAQEDSRLLLLGAHGMPTPATDPVLAQAHRRLEGGAKQTLRYAELVRRMRAGEEGTARIGEQEAQQLGLGQAEAVAAFRPIRVKGGSHWSVATLVSTTALRSVENAVVLRLSAAAGLVGLLLAAFGAYGVRASRRAVELRASQRHAARLARVLDNIPTGVLALSAQGVITTANRALRERMPALGERAHLKDAFPRAPEAVVARLEALLSSATSAHRVVSIQGEPLELFGEQGHFRIHAVPLDPRDSDTQVLLVVEDLSNVRALESQLLRAEKLATVGILAAGIAHEIGTPLGVVRGRAEYTLGKLGREHTQADGLSVIIEEIDRVSRTIRQLLDFSRAQPPEVQRVPLGPIAKSVHELLLLEAERRGLRLSVSVPDELPLLSADPDQLRQVLVNLALNACDACTPGGLVEICARQIEGPLPGSWEQVRLEIRDDGCGIEADDLNQVFDPFFTTKKRGQGTGLGLTMVAQIVRNHGAQVELSSQRGRGTCVSLLWPAAPSAAEVRDAV